MHLSNCILMRPDFVDWMAIGDHLIHLNKCMGSSNDPNKYRVHRMHLDNCFIMRLNHVGWITIWDHLIHLARTVVI